jgi:hypothetical protein
MNFSIFHNHHSHDRTSISGSFMETKLMVSPDDIRSASNSQLRHVQELISTELKHRSQARPYFVVEQSTECLRVEEAHLIDDEDVPRYVRNHHGGVILTLFITPESIFHQTPAVGQVFDIYCKDDILMLLVV